MEKKLKIGETYITEYGDKRKLLRLSKNYCYFENLSKDVYDEWNYEKDGTFKMSVGYVSSCIECGYLKVYEG